MKLDFKGIRFQTWLAMLVFASLVLIILWFAQIQSLNPFYATQRIRQTEKIAESVYNYLGARAQDAQDKDTMKESLERYLYQNDACIVVTGVDGTLMVRGGSGGGSCIISDLQSKNRNDYLNLVMSMTSQADHTINTRMSTNYTDLIKYIHGSIETIDGTPYVVFVEIPSQILASTIMILQRQFIYIMLAMLVLAMGIGLIFSTMLTRPIKKLKESADRLGAGDLSVRFAHGGYTELNELADRLNYATNELAKTEELRRDLLANVSHDIKTPLTMIRAYGEMIQDISGNDPKLRNEHMQVILQEAAYLDRLINDMLELSKYQAGTIVFNNHPYNLSQQIQDMVAIFENNPLHPATFVTQVDADLWVDSDEIKISQIINNYVSNAMKHIGDDKQIIVRAFRDDKLIKVEVEDHGEGISEDQQALIWDRYFKIDKHFSRSMDSSGLGLAIVRGICLSGHLGYGVRSTPGKGSVFWVTLSPTDTHNSSGQHGKLNV